MAQQSVFRGFIEFFVELGVYDVVLPFLLVFSIIYAILERTKVLGTDEVDGRRITKKNLNAMIAFVIGFFVVASTKLVSVINSALADVVLLILLVIFFLLMVGSFYKEGTEEFLDDSWKQTLTFILFIGIILIFMNALDWLGPFWGFLVNNWESRWVGSLLLLIIIIIFMYYITKEGGSSAPAKKE